MKKYMNKFETKDYENKSRIRWDFAKRQSNWHFNTQRPAEPGKDSYTYICRFDTDFTEAIRLCLPKTVENTWVSILDNFSKNRNEPNKHLYNVDTGETKSYIHTPIYHSFNPDNIEVFKKVSEYIGMDDTYIRFHNQTTGNMLVEHIDNLKNRQVSADNFKAALSKHNPEVARRFVVMLDDWKLGQVFMLGNACWTQWRAGDCITWEWQNIPHATCNMGWENRPMLQLSGIVTERTQQVLAEANINKIVTL